MVVPPSLVDFPELAELPELAEPVEAAAQLAHLRAAAPRSLHPAERFRPQTGHPRGKVRGSEEKLLVALRHLIGAAEPETPPGPLIDHLLADLRPGSDLHLAGIALHVAAPIVRSAAETLVTTTQAEPPESVTMPILGHSVVLRPEGPDPESLAAAEERISVEGVPDRGRPWMGYALLVFGVAVLATAFATSATLPLAGLALALFAAGGYGLWHRRRRERADAEYVTAQLSELRELAEGAVWALHEYARENEKRVQDAAADLAELTRLLRRGPPRPLGSVLRVVPPSAGDRTETHGTGTRVIPPPDTDVPGGGVASPGTFQDRKGQPVVISTSAGASRKTFSAMRSIRPSQP
ncbi:hypothetical protein HDA43_003728 [Streptosporangium sandarakinum]|uniref:Uncharacterized protein n=1 Tax=Streptosporangium sandarakinum TaxID=1260955 RepID=A0A852UZA6_9ACTN|nr:hypothetical protein [Streptosporangium sandarakinum]NYF41569.1 hypothetical protein [Streptosporangium sandarakinum]